MGNIVVVRKNGKGLVGVEFRTKASLVSKLTDFGLDAGEINSVLREIAVVQSQPNYWEVDI